MTSEPETTMGLQIKLATMLRQRGFEVGKSGWLDLDTLRVAIQGDQVTVIRFTDTRTRVVRWEFDMSLQSTPYAVIAAAIKAALTE
jgi:hypothetical protein